MRIIGIWTPATTLPAAIKGKMRPDALLPNVVCQLPRIEVYLRYFQARFPLQTARNLTVGRTPQTPWRCTCDQGFNATLQATDVALLQTPESQRERALNVWDVEVSGLGAPWQRAARLVSSMPDLALLPERWEGAGPGRAGHHSHKGTRSDF